MEKENKNQRLTKKRKINRSNIIQSHKKAKVTLEQKNFFLFNKKKYIILICSLLLLVLGFLLMSGGGALGSEFNPEIFSSRRIIIAPTILIIAFIMSGIAIMIKK